MRTIAALVLTLTAASVGAAPAADPWKRVEWKQVSAGNLSGVVLLGTSEDGKRYAYVHSEVADGSGFLSIEGAIVDVASGEAIERWALDGAQLVPGEAKVMRQRKAYEAFLAKVRARGVRFDPARLWTEQDHRRVSPDGKLALRWRVGRMREGEEASGQTYTAMLEDRELGDQAALLELYAGSDTTPVRKGPPVFEQIYSTPDGAAFFVVVTSPGSMMCWDANDYDLLRYSLARVRVDRPLRELNNAGMAAYRAGRLREAQALFEMAVTLDPHGPRARYNLAAVSARLGDDDAALAALRRLCGYGIGLLRWKLASDPDFADAKKRPRFRKALVELHLLFEDR